MLDSNCGHAGPGVHSIDALDSSATWAPFLVKLVKNKKYFSHFSLYLPSVIECFQTDVLYWAYFSWKIFKLMFPTCDFSRKVFLHNMLSWSEKAKSFSQQISCCFTVLTNLNCRANISIVFFKINFHRPTFFSRKKMSKTVKRNTRKCQKSFWNMFSKHFDVKACIIVLGWHSWQKV